MSAIPISGNYFYWNFISRKRRITVSTHRSVVPKVSQQWNLGALPVQFLSLLEEILSRKGGDPSRRESPLARETVVCKGRLVSDHRIPPVTTGQDTCYQAHRLPYVTCRSAQAPRVDKTHGSSALCLHRTSSYEDALLPHPAHRRISDDSH